MKPQMTLAEVGQALGMDPKRVWYIEQCAFKKLRKRLAHLQDGSGQDPRPEPNAVAAKQKEF